MHRVFVPCSRLSKGIYVQNSRDNFRLHHTSKVPSNSAKRIILECREVNINSELIPALERLSLVNLDDNEALRSLQCSIQFADNVTEIDTDNIQPLYTVLYEQSLHLRSDQISDGNCREYVLVNAKCTDEDYFVSPPGNIPLLQENTE